MNVLIACERSGVVREAFNAYQGVNAVSCDLEPCEDERPDFHVVGDALEVMKSRRWDLIIAHPPCRYLSVSGMHWNGRVAGRAEKTEAGLRCACQFFNAPARFKCIENPVSILSTRLGQLFSGGPWVIKANSGRATNAPTQIIQPHQFGANASKKTCLWHNLPKLKPTLRIAGRFVEWPRGSGRMVERWENQTDSGQNRLGPSATREMDRARTYPGIGQAMAALWVPYIFANL